MRAGTDDRGGGWRSVRAPDPDLHPQEAAAAKHRSDYSRWWLRAADRAAAAGQELLGLAAPVDCVCCGAEDFSLCAACERQVRVLTRTPFRAEGQAPALMDVNGSIVLPVVAAGVYREELAQALLSFKKHGQGHLESVLAKSLGRAIRAAGGSTPGLRLIPVPTSSGAYRKRGFSPVHLMLKYLHRHGGLGEARLSDALRRGRPDAGPEGPGGPDGPGVPGLTGRLRLAVTGSGAPAAPGGQKGLGRGARAKRVRGSMRARQGFFTGDLRGCPCIIVDDVLTTGATLAEAARAVHAAGGLVKGAVVLAATRPPDAADLPAAAGARTGKDP